MLINIRVENHSSFDLALVR